MTVDCSNIQDLVRAVPLVQGCDIIRNGMLRMATPFRYADGSQVDLFLGQQPDLFEGWKLTDLGHTTAYLLDLHLKPWTTKRRKQIVTDICTALDVKREGGELAVYLKDGQMPLLGDAMVRLGQACIRVADLAFTQRVRPANAFREEVEEFIEMDDLRYEPDIVLPGQFGKEVPVDFEVQGRRTKSLVQTLSTGNSAAAHGLSNEIFRRWYDLNQYHQTHQFLTIYDASNDVFREDDLLRLGTLSQVFAFPADPESIKLAMAA
ncbi:MAG TPA: DUF1828 domain-containing protein [Tepidisphaeraceae bacterium]|jgi:hypothetical protein